MFYSHYSGDDWRDYSSFCWKSAHDFAGFIRAKFVDPEQKRIEKEDNGKRNVIEGTYGVGKRKYNIGLLKTILDDTSKLA